MSAGSEITGTQSGVTAAPQTSAACRTRAPEAPAGAGQPERGRRGRGLAFAVVIAAAVMDLLDSTITQVAAPSIRRELVEPSIFGHRPYRAGLVFSIVFVGSLGGIVMIFNVFLQNGLGFTAWHSALTTARWAAGAFVGSAVGGIGAIFFVLAGGHGRHVPVYLGAAEWTALATAGLLACSFAVAFGLPRRAREMSAPADHR